MMETRVEVHEYGCWHIMREILHDESIEDKCTCDLIRSNPVRDQWGNIFMGTITKEIKLDGTAKD